MGMKVLLEVSHFSSGYSENVVFDVSFQVNSGQIIGVLGRNGSGKSTLLKGMMGTIPSKGKVYVSGKDFHSLSIKKRAQYMTMLMQCYETIEGISTLEMIEMARYAYSSFYSLNQNLSFRNQLIDMFGVENLLNKDFMSLSEGQKQLIQLIRVFYQDTPMILLDEPDSTLDFDNRHMIYHHIHHWVTSKQKGALIVLHDPILALKYCDVIMLMSEGRMIEKINMHDDNCQVIEKKLHRLYPNILIRKDQKLDQYYCLLRSCDDQESEDLHVNN